MSFGTVGYDAADAAASGGGGSWWEFMVPVGETRRFVVLDDQPFAFFSHDTFKMAPDHRGSPIVCLKRNNLEAEHGACPFCERNEELQKQGGKAKDNASWPSQVGWLTVLDCGKLEEDESGAQLSGYRKDGKEYIFQIRPMGLKTGSDDKPGMLRKMRKITKDHGNARGLIIDAQRDGKMEARVGATWIVRKDLGRLKFTDIPSLRAAIQGMQGFGGAMHEDAVKRIAPASKANPLQLDYLSLFKIRNRAALLSIMSGVGSPKKNGDDGDDVPNGFSGYGGYGGSGGSDEYNYEGGGNPINDDDIPF